MSSTSLSSVEVKKDSIFLYKSTNIMPSIIFVLGGKYLQRIFTLNHSEILKALELERVLNANYLLQIMV